MQVAIPTVRIKTSRPRGQVPHPKSYLQPPLPHKTPTTQWENGTSIHSETIKLKSCSVLFSSKVLEKGGDDGHKAQNERQTLGRSRPFPPFQRAGGRLHGCRGRPARTVRKRRTHVVCLFGSLVWFFFLMIALKEDHQLGGKE